MTEEPEGSVIDDVTRWLMAYTSPDNNGDGSMALEDLRIYQQAAEISDEISVLVETWPTMHQQILGIQICRAADSIANNISEGYGRTSTGERIQFFFYADGSIQEVKNQVRSSLKRRLISQEAHDSLKTRLRKLSISVIEFCAAILKNDPTYTGKARELVANRRAWLVKQYEQRQNSTIVDTDTD